ncbi:PBP1A family penicillin-binding protein [Candidatus Wolfebacteria bacterium]|nr:PBP1A family penicillin-binding protein [Candidatus Wolfebacteria bacterium]
MKHLKLLRTHHQKVLAILFGTGFFMSGVLILWIALLPTPDLNAFEERKVIQSTKIYDRTGEFLLYDLSQDIKRSLVPLSDISPFIQNATIAIEDDRFYEHFGIRPISFVRALLVNITKGSFVQGGSTITQQVVKNSILTREKSITRKLKEWIIAVKLERVYSKDQILSVYLNESPYGGNLYGVEEASRAFFGKSANDTSIAEAAYLAALPKAPTYYSPYGNNRERLEDRKETVLLRMFELGFVTEEDYNEAIAEEVVFLPRGDQSIKAPHFVFYVQEKLERLYGPRVLEEGGFAVITTLDFDLQQKAEEIVLRYALANSERHDAENAALIAIDPATGEILTMVGSRDYFDPDIDGNFNIALAERQPGSTFKPFVYAQALKEGFTRDTILFDLPTQFSARCDSDVFNSDDGCYSPSNYDDIFRGPMKLIDALAQSVNVPAVKLLYLVGIQDVINLSSRMGLTTLVDPARYGLSLVLGGGEVRLLDMTSAYSVFANKGVRNDTVSILEVRDKNNTVIYQPKYSPRTVLEESVAAELNYMLSNNVARTPAFGVNSPLYFPGYDVAAKTGTTNDYRDAWIIGYTPNIAVGAWAGNNDNRPMDKKVAGFIIAPLWNEFMREALLTRPKSFFGEIPEIPSDLKPILRGVWSVENTNNIPFVHSILHYVEKSNPRGPQPLVPGNDSQYGHWEFSVQKWLLGEV